MRSLFVFIFIAFFSNYNFSQLLLEENFDYTANQYLSLESADWPESPTGSYDIRISNGNLNYTNYPSSGIGKCVYLDGGGSGRCGVHRSFTTTNSGTVYCSFLFQVYDNIDIDLNSTNGDNIINFESSGGTPRAYVYIKQGSLANTFQLGIAKASTSNLQYVNTNLSIGVTYLIVFSYTFVSGSTTNDIIKFWINPDLSGPEPSSLKQFSSGSDFSDIEFIQIQQQPKSGNTFIDGIRVATSWAQAPLPVELTSFTASLMNNSVVLKWRTATEVNNYGFEIERSLVIGHQSLDKSGKIGFIPGNGNSNSIKDYTFTDSNPPSGNVKYRLKQIDSDGKYKYSDEVEVFVPAKKDFYLFPAYPNPCNPAAKIRWRQSGEGNTNISVYNSLGVRVCTLVNERRRPGEHEVVFSGDNFATGVYFVRVQVGDKCRVEKVLLLK